MMNKEQACPTLINQKFEVRRGIPDIERKALDTSSFIIPCSVFDIQIFINE
jgi:hypothetical protein